MDRVRRGRGVVLLLEYKMSEFFSTAQIHPTQLGYGIGNTPLQAITLSIDGKDRTVYLKLEGLNPTNSVKDRTAFALVRALEAQGGLHQGSTLIESTSGNLGVALARLCWLKGYRFIAVIDPKTTVENVAKMQHFGAQVEMVKDPDTHGGYLLARLAYIRRLLDKHPNYHWTDQYHNPANPSIHAISTGPEVYHQMQQQVDVIFAPVSTGGTLAGVGRFFREVQPTASIVGVDAVGSTVFGAPPAPRKLTGIGSSQASSFLWKNLYDEALLVKDEEAFSFCRFLASSTGIAVGGSSGAVLAACASYLSRHPEKERVVCICADHGIIYRSSIFSDVWLREQGLVLSQSFLGSVERISSNTAANSRGLEGDVFLSRVTN